MALKKLFASARSVAVSAFRLSDGYGQKLRYRVLSQLLKSVPHTLCRMAKITTEGEVDMMVVPGKYQMLRISEGSKLSLNIPGIEETEETVEGLRVFLDLELQHEKDFVPVEVELKKKVNALFIKGFLQKQDIRKYFSARVNLPLREICEPLKTEIKDGGLVVTIPKVVKKESTTA